MAKFIELHGKYDNSLVSINTEKISSFSGIENGGTLIGMGVLFKDGEYAWLVKESYAEVKALIEGAPCCKSRC